MEVYCEDIKARLTARHLACVRFSGDVNNKLVLDVGCWIGWYEKLADSNNIVGLDLNLKALYQAKKNNPGNDFVYGSALYLPFKDICFDKILVFDVLEHVSSSSESILLGEASRILRSHGLIILSTPSDCFFSKILDPAYFLANHRHYSFNMVKKLLKLKRFYIVDAEYGGGFGEAFSMILLYFFKQLNLEVPFKGWFERWREKEYQGRGFVTLFVKAVKIRM